MRKIFPLVLFAAFAFHGSLGDRYDVGYCPIIDPVAIFNITNFLGRWYVIQKPMTLPHPCLMYDVTVGEHPGQYAVTEIMQRRKFLSSSYRESRTTALLTIPDPSIPAKMELRAPLTIKPAMATVFMTNNRDYVGIFTCKKWLIGHKWSAEILSRTPALDLNIVSEIRSKLSSYSIDPFHLSVIQQDGCVVRGDPGGSIVQAVSNTGDSYSIPTDVIR